MIGQTVYGISAGISAAGSILGLVFHFLHKPQYDSLKDWRFVIIAVVFATIALILELTGNSKKREATQQTEEEE